MRKVDYPRFRRQEYHNFGTEKETPTTIIQVGQQAKVSVALIQTPRSGLQTNPTIPPSTHNINLLQAKVLSRDL